MKPSQPTNRSSSALHRAQRELVIAYLRDQRDTVLLWPPVFADLRKRGINRGRAEEIIDELAAEGTAELFQVRAGVIGIALKGKP